MPSPPAVDRVPSTTAAIELDELVALLRSDREHAFIDVREAVPVQHDGSPLLAVHVPSSRIEVDIARLVPRRTTPIVLTDGGDDDLAAHAGAVLRAAGYSDVRVLRGGTAAWAAGGYELFAGAQALGQAFGEWVEAQYGTPHISAAELAERLARGDDVVLLDSRPLAEFAWHSLPGARCAPGAELVRRAAQVVDGSTALVVVNCAGRTRGILGAQALITSGFPHAVVALENGTQGWLLSGSALDRGRRDVVPPPAPPATAAPDELVARLRVQLTTFDEVERIRRAADRTLFLFDVRTPEEHAAGHLRGAHSVPSWDVVPWVFRHAATRNAELVLVDDADGQRAAITAWWLQHIGWGRVSVLAGWPAQHTTTEPTPTDQIAEPDVAWIDAEGVAAAIAAGGTVILDVGSSFPFRQRRIPGVWFAIRAHLAEAFEALPAAERIVVTSDDGSVAAFAAADLAALTTVPLFVLRGGTEAWIAGGHPLDVSPGGDLLTGTADWPGHAWFLDGEAQLAGFRDYLAWEISLAGQVERDVTSPFRVPTGAVTAR